MTYVNDLEREIIHLGRLPTSVHLLVDGKNSSVLEIGIQPSDPSTDPPATSIACSKYTSREIGQDLDTGTSSPWSVRKLEQPWCCLGVTRSGRGPEFFPYLGQK